MPETKKKIVFIINPVSGGRSKTRVEAAIKKYLDRDLYDYQIIYTAYRHHAIEIARNESEKGTDVVVAVGGDGSANEVARGLVNSNTVMGLIHVGSGNGLAHYLRIPVIYRKSIEILNNHNIKRIDTALLNDTMFISIAGMGFDALVAEEFAGSKQRGFVPYLRIIKRNIFSYKPELYHIRFKDKDIKTKALFVSFANSDQFGFNASIAPVARISDGLIDLCIVHPIPMYKVPHLANMLFLKIINRSQYVEIYKTDSAIVETENEVPCQFDGEPSSRCKRVQISIVPRSLNMIVPYKKTDPRVYLRGMRQSMKLQSKLSLK